LRRDKGPRRNVALCRFERFVSNASLNRASAPPIEHQLWSASVPISLAIPDFDAANSALVPRQVNRPCSTVSPDVLPNLDVGVGAVLEMYHHSLELYLAALNEKADRSEPPASIDTNVVMIVLTIDTRISEAFPPAIISITPLTIGSETDAQQEHQRTEHTN